MNRIFLIIIYLLITATAFSQNPADYILKAKALIESGKTDEAVKIMTEAIAKMQDSRFYILRGDALTTAGRYEDAIKDYNTANNIEPASGDYGLARVYALSGEAGKSLNYLESSLKSKFRHGEKEVMLDPAFSGIENSPEWRKFWKTERYGIPESKIQELKYYISVGKISEAQEITSELEKDYPSDNLTLYAGALVNFSAGRYREVITTMTKLTTSEKNNSDYTVLLARAQMASGNPSGAILSYSKLIESGTPDAGLYLQRAECYRKTGEYEKAMKDISKYLDFYPQNKEALRMAGKTAAAMGDIPVGINYFTRNIELNPGDPECFIDRADSYFTARAWELAAKDYGMALDLKPDISDAWLNKGIALASMGKTNDACFDLRKAYSLGNKKATTLISKYCIH